MKILFFTQDIPYPITSGHHVRTFHYLMPLIKAHEVTVAAFGDREKDAAGIAYLEQAGAAVKLIGNKRTFKKHQRILSAIKALFTPLPYSIYMRFDLYLKHELDKLIDDCGFDIVICDGIHLSLNLSKDIKCRKILDEHNIESTLVSRYAATEKNFLKKTYACMELIKFRRFENMTWERFDEIHVCSETDRGQIVGQIKDVTVRVVPNPVNTEKFRPRGIPERPGSILYTGLMGWRPNIDAVVHFAGDIYPLIKRSVPDITFTVIGKNPAPGVEELGKRDETIKVLGFVDDIAAHICESQVFVVPLRIGSGRFRRRRCSFAELSGLEAETG
jgi:glycosyltransferase involved in cell wall biosynthesis